MIEKKILFVCRNNSIRSQMAEAITNSLYSKTHISFSGGTKPTPINENTIKVLNEIGIDISNKESKDVNIFKNMIFDYIVTVCDDKNCVYLQNSKNYINKTFKDPNISSKTNSLDSFREVRDEIKEWIIKQVEMGII